MAVAALAPSPAPPKRARARRDVRLDALRGLCLVVMTIDHLPFRDNLAAHLTWRPLGFFSAAAVFVLLAGFLASRDRGPTWAWRRAGQLYLAHASLVTLLTLCIIADGGTHEAGWRAMLPLYFRHPWQAWDGSLLLLHLPSTYLCILPLYVMLFLALPLFQWCLRQGYGGWLMAGSSMAWGLAQAGFGAPSNDPASFYTGYFDPLAWQFPFVAGLWIGYHRPQVPHSRRLLAGAATLALVLFVLRHPRLAGLPSPLFAAPDPTFGPLTVLNFGVWLYGWSYVPNAWFARWSDSDVYQALVRLGRHSLPVFLAHQTLGFGMMLFDDEENWGASLQAFSIFVTVAVLLQVADFCELRGRDRRRSQFLQNLPASLEATS